ncbi:TVP38/TMEM64 family membrane protein [Pseudoscourfieldia marina]
MAARSGRDDDDDEHRVVELPPSSGSTFGTTNDAATSTVHSPSRQHLIDMAASSPRQRRCCIFLSSSFRPEHPWRFALKIAIAVILVTAILVVFLVPQIRVHERIPTWLKWIDAHKAEGAPIFAVVYATCVVLLVPAAILSLGAGAAFGLWIGVVVVWFGATIGQTLAFALGRFLLRRWVERTLLTRFERWNVIDRALRKDAWKIVGLLRLAPLLPYSAMNYILAVTPIPAWHYTLVSAVAIIPGTFLYVYIGSIIGDITKLVDDESSRTIRPEVYIATAVVTGLVVVAVVVLTTIYAKRALQARLAEAEQDLEEEEEEQEEEEQEEEQGGGANGRNGPT